MHRGHAQPTAARRYALRWGDKHRTASIAECAEKCKAWAPQPPAYYACNIFVYCGKPKCYAPAALPPGDMGGQCWLKHQDDPIRPQAPPTIHSRPDMQPRRRVN